MNTLKEYVVKEGTTINIGGIPVDLKNDTVVLSGTSLEKLNETRKAIYPRNKTRSSSFDTFNADEQLQEQKGLRTSAEEILKTIYEKHVAAKPDGNWASWEKCVEDGTVDLVVDAMKAYAAEPGQPVPAGEWISVEDEMPRHNIGVLVFIPGEDNHITSGMWDRDDVWVLLDEYRCPEAEVTHWRPLPAPPSPKQEDKQ